MKVDILVIGAGHAGIEASLISAKMGAKTCLLTSNLDRIGHMSCNPAIGGIAKGHLVKEIDAIGGEIGIGIDKSGIQFRRLNLSKGPAVRSSRAQADKMFYARGMKHAVESVPNLLVKQGMAESLRIENGSVLGVVTGMGEVIEAASTVITTGTFLNGLIHIGRYTEPAGRGGDAPSIGLAASLLQAGFRMGRMKTGTVPRLDEKTIRWELLEEQWGDSPIPTFSFFRETSLQRQISCWITYTNERTHEVIRRNLDQSAMYSGKITGVGPRYCPCIEDKVVRFADKPKHQIFLEPEGLDTREIYPNGLSNSLPLPIQVEFLRTIEGLENVEVMRPGYAIEYDYVDPTELLPSLETKKIKSLFHAGQINGTTGYEEAAAQGIMAGINAVLSIDRKEPFILKRSEAYIGVLIDDLVTKGTTEPYRMFTSRAEHRLHLREDNADQRLFSYGKKFGVHTSDVVEKFESKMTSIEATQRKIESIRLTPTAEVNKRMVAMETTPLKSPSTLAELLRRPEVDWSKIVSIEPSLANVERQVAEQVEIAMKYDGYLAREKEEIARAERDEGETIPESFDFGMVPSLSNEVREKLVRIQPRTLGQAARISGVTPAAVSILSIFVRKHRSVEPQNGNSL